MVKKYKVKGMACVHCADHVKRALESLPGVKAEVSLEPAVAVIEFEDKRYGLDEFQKIVTEEAGDYILSEE